MYMHVEIEESWTSELCVATYTVRNIENVLYYNNTLRLYVVILRNSEVSITRRAPIVAIKGSSIGIVTLRPHKRGGHNPDVSVKGGSTVVGSTPGHFQCLLPPTLRTP